MPTYTYRFEDDTTVDVEQSIHDDPISVMHHPEKNVPMEVKRVPQLPVAKFKGEGWARG